MLSNLEKPRDHGSTQKEAIKPNGDVILCHLPNYKLVSLELTFRVNETFIARVQEPKIKGIKCGDKHRYFPAC